MKNKIVEDPNTIVADKLAKAANEKRLIRLTTVNLYSLKAEGTPFGLPFCAVSDHFALLAQKQMLPCSNLYKVGSICLHNGKVNAERSPVLVLDNGVK